MNHLSFEQKELHIKMMDFVSSRAGAFGYKYEAGVPLLRMEAVTENEGRYWPEKEFTYHPPFRYSLDALQVVERLLTNKERRIYADLVRVAVCGSSTGIMDTHALAQIAPSTLRFDCLCQTLGFSTVVAAPQSFVEAHV